MAKSMRSKRRRAMRAIKRERNSVRDDARLERLKNIDIATLRQQATIVLDRSVGATREHAQAIDDDVTIVDDSSDQMQVDGVKTAARPSTTSKFHKKSMRDKDGNYPEWMSQRRIHRLQKKKMPKILKNSKKYGKGGKW